MSLYIRDFDAGDRAAVNRIALAAFTQYQEVFDDWPAFAAWLGTMADLASQLEMVVATWQGSVVGAVGYTRPDQPKIEHLPPEHAAIRMLVVEPAARGKGIGRALTDECLRRAQRDGSRAIALHTSTFMEVALPMYRRLGFVEVATAEPLTIYGAPYGIYLKTF